MISNFFGYLRRPKVSDKVWISQDEISKFFRLSIWLYSAQAHQGAFDILRTRIVTLVKRSGFNFTFLYLKEVLRLTIRFLAGTPEPKSVNKILVKKDHIGLPTIIPLSLRRILEKGPLGDRVMIVCILSVLSIFRVFPTVVRVSLETITSPFDGVSRIIDPSILKRAL